MNYRLTNKPIHRHTRTAYGRIEIALKSPANAPFTSCLCESGCFPATVCMVYADMSKYGVCVCARARFFTFVFRHFLSTNKSRTLISYKTLVKHILFALFCSLQISTPTSFIAVIVAVIVFRILCTVVIRITSMHITLRFSRLCLFLPLMILSCSPCAPSPTARLNCIYIRAHSLIRVRVCVWCC